MQRNKIFSIITIICFCSIVFIPIGLVTMWYSTAWKKKIKFILSATLTLLYAGIVFLLLNFEPSVNTKGVSLPIEFSAGATTYETSVTTGKNPTDKDIEGEKSKTKTDEIKENQEEPERLPRGVKKGGRKVGSRFYAIMFFLFMVFLILWQNYKNSKKKVVYENPYVDTNQYKLPLNENSKMPMVHFLRLRLNQNERIYFATETTQKENEGDFIVTNERVVVFSKEGDYEFPLPALTAVSSVTNSVMLLTCGERKYYIFMPESQLKYALAVVRWAFSKISD